MVLGMVVLELGMVVEGEGGRVLFGRGVGEKEYSEKMAIEIDTEVQRIIEEAQKKGEKILTDHRKALDAIAAKLMEVETIERDEFEKLLIIHGITPKKKDDRIDKTETITVID
jgi:cell division protease FtsH